jgi:hypothetical protein
VLNKMSSWGARADVDLLDTYTEISINDFQTGYGYLQSCKAQTTRSRCTEGMHVHSRVVGCEKSRRLLVRRISSRYAGMMLGIVVLIQL